MAIAKDRRTCGKERANPIQAAMMKEMATLNLFLENKDRIKLVGLSTIANLTKNGGYKAKRHHNIVPPKISN